MMGASFNKKAAGKIISDKPHGDPDGNRTRVAGVKGRCPKPLDDGARYPSSPKAHAKKAHTDRNSEP